MHLLQGEQPPISSRRSLWAKGIRPRGPSLPALPANRGSRALERQSCMMFADVGRPAGCAMWFRELWFRLPCRRGFRPHPFQVSSDENRGKKVDRDGGGGGTSVLFHTLFYFHSCFREGIQLLRNNSFLVLGGGGYSSFCTVLRRKYVSQSCCIYLWVEGIASFLSCPLSER